MGSGGRSVRCFPAICAEQEVDHVVFCVGCAAEVVVDHLADGGCPIYMRFISM